jgi:hypothetical protein
MCFERKIVAVVEQDKQNLKNYLTGEIDTCPQIDLIAMKNFSNNLTVSQSSKSQRYRFSNSLKVITC